MATEKKNWARSVVWVQMTIFALISPAWSSGDLDRQYRLETLGILKPVDNVDGLFGEPIESAFQEYFTKQSRFILSDLRAAEVIFDESKLAYEKAIFDVEILKKLARSTHSDSFIRTQVKKTGAHYSVTLSWLHAPLMEQIASVQFVLEEPDSGGIFEKQYLSENLQKSLYKLVHELPFVGQVSGRDRDFITVSIGTEEKVAKGDTLNLATLEEVKRHPLLNKVVEWRTQPTGRVLVEKVEEGMSFGKVLDEEPGSTIAHFQKVVRIQRAQRMEAVENTEGTVPTLAPGSAEQRPQEKIDQPKQGWVGLSLPLGSYNRQFENKAGTVSNTGGGFSFGGQMDGELWLTRNWLIGGKLQYDSWNLTQTTANGTLSTVSAKGGVSGSDLKYVLNAGFAIPLAGDFYGPKAMITLGYKQNATTLPLSIVENTSPFWLSSMFLGVGVRYPFLERWGAVVDFKFKLLGWSKNNSLSATSTNDVNLYVGGYYNLSARLSIRAGLEYTLNSAEYSDGSTLTEKTVTFAPALLYYF